MAEDETTPAAAEAEPEAEAEPKPKPKRKRKPRNRKAGRSFRLKDGGPNAIAFGSGPRISLAAGATFTTEDERLARRLAAHPLLEEV